MPNWVFNGLTIEGNPESITKLVEQMNSPFHMVHDSWDTTTQSYTKKDTLYPSPIFSFWNIIKPTDIEAYQGQRDHSLPIEEAMKFKGDSWYEFNNREWGTKWDVAVSSDNNYKDTYIEEYENGNNRIAYYNFDTAWSPPIAAIEKLSAQYPDLLFTLAYKEETGWGGEMELLRGKIISTYQYVSKCDDCDAIDTMEYCDNDCGEICSECNYLGESDLEAVAECQTHKIYLDDNHIPSYRKVETELPPKVMVKD